MKWLEVIALDSRASKKINKYRNHTEKNYRHFNNFCLHLSTELGIALKCSLVIGQSDKGAGTGGGQGAMAPTLLKTVDFGTFEDS